MLAITLASWGLMTALVAEAMYLEDLHDCAYGYNPLMQCPPDDTIVRYVFTAIFLGVFFAPATLAISVRGSSSSLKTAAQLGRMVR
jgi:hypothetical protein